MDQFIGEDGRFDLEGWFSLISPTLSDHFSKWLNETYYIPFKKFLKEVEDFINSIFSKI